MSSNKIVLKNCKNDLIQIRLGKAVTSSIQVAKMFEKDHSDVLKSIRKLDCSSVFIDGNFTPYHYFSELNENVVRKLPMYYITRDGFTFLAMGFTGKKAAQFKEWYISEFNRMEALLHQQAIDQAVAAVRPVVLQVPKVKYRYRTRIVPAAMNPQDRKDLEVVRKFRDEQGGNLYRVAQTMLDNHTAYMDLIGDGVDYQDLKRRFHHTHDLVKFLLELEKRA